MKDPSGKLTVKGHRPRSPIGSRPPVTQLSHSPSLGPGDMYTIFEEESSRSRENSLAKNGTGLDEMKHSCPKAPTPRELETHVATTTEEPTLTEICRNEAKVRHSDGENEKNSSSTLVEDCSMYDAEGSSCAATMEGCSKASKRPPLMLKFSNKRGAVTKDTIKEGGRPSSRPSTPFPGALQGADAVASKAYDDLDLREQSPLKEGISKQQSQSVGELHKVGRSHSSEPISLCPLRSPTRPGHQRKGSLPIHIQRAFPELASPIRPQSPLVLHDLRSSSPTTSPVLTRRRGSLPQYHFSLSEPGTSNSNSSDDEGKPVLRGRLSQRSSALNASPSSSPKRTHSASPPPIAKRPFSPSSSPHRSGRRPSEGAKLSCEARKVADSSDSVVETSPAVDNHCLEPIATANSNSDRGSKIEKMDKLPLLPTPSCTAESSAPTGG